MRATCVLIFIGIATIRPSQAAAQTLTAATAITAEEVARHIQVIAHDSMLGRATPSPGLASTAQYVAEQFQRAGLKKTGGALVKYRRREGRPTGEELAWIRPYQIPLRFDFSRSRIVFTAGTTQATAPFSTAAYLAPRIIPKAPVSAGVVLVTGIHRDTIDPNKQMWQEKVILYVVPERADSTAVQSSIQLLRWTRNRGVVILSAEDSLTFAERLHDALQLPIVRRQRSTTRTPWTARVGVNAVPGVHSVFAAAGLDWARARTDTIPRVLEVPELKIAFEPQLQATPDDATTAPNVIGVLEGSDSLLKREYLVFVAHMDHLGVRRGRADSIPNGANDNASGTAGLIELAKAFGQEGARPRRSLVFFAASGDKGLWGSDAFISQAKMNSLLDLGGGDVAAVIDLDMIGRGATDSVRVGGLGLLDLAVSPDWQAAAHPELRLTVVDGGTPFTPRSAHFAFARVGIPILYFHNGAHEDDSTVTDSPTAIDTEQAARILQLVYYVGQNIANTDQRPRWNREGRRQFLANRSHEP